MLNTERLLQEPLKRQRVLLARQQAPITLALLGALCGLLTGGVVLIFRGLVETVQSQLLPLGLTESYELLGLLQRAALPLAGMLVLWLIWRIWARQGETIGIIHVLERLSYHEALLPLKQALLQFFGAAVAIISGFSVGREGPSVHLGAAVSSLLGQRLDLPNNAIRILVACGVAAAIAGSFNTPLAGVIFAMEVVMMEYTIAGFTPVILAAVAATVLSRAFYGDDIAFAVTQLDMRSLWELPWIVLVGICIGLLAAMFIRSLAGVTRWLARFSQGQRFWVAGLGMSVLALLCPEVMSIGYDTVNAVMLGEIAIAALILIVAAKMLASVLCIASGVPGGLIGPVLMIGACAGGVLGIIGSALSSHAAPSGLYAMLGMAAMMSAVLQAPLAALLALMELTGNPNILMPGMLAVISANLTTKEIFGNGSVFLSQMQQRGLDYSSNPVSLQQRRIGVTAIMQTGVRLTDSIITREQAAALLQEKPQWLIIRREDKRLLLPAGDLQNHLQQTEHAKPDSQPEQADIDLLEVPGQRLVMAQVAQSATLYRANRTLEESGADALFVSRRLGPRADEILGVITRVDMDAANRSVM